jgi:hypothetical protein
LPKNENRRRKFVNFFKLSSKLLEEPTLWEGGIERKKERKEGKKGQSPMEKLRVPDRWESKVKTELICFSNKKIFYQILLLQNKQSTKLS